MTTIETSAVPLQLTTGVQAIARLLVEQHLHDRRAGLNTASFVSGYQGSPLGGLDTLLAGMPDLLTEHQVHFVPGLNEELAATSVWGSQTDLPSGRRRYDGVVGFWYGKGPGVDRAMDALRHANMYGANPRGGMILLVGDDPASKSSTVPAASERSLAALGIPVLYPRTAEEIITLGLHGVALSRASGSIVALKIVADVADGSWAVPEQPFEVQTSVPAVTWNDRPFRYLQRPMAVASHQILPAEADLVGPRAAVVQAYAATNGVNPIEVAAPGARVGLVSAGTTFDSMMQALTDLGLPPGRLAAEGLRVLRLGMIAPLEEAAVRDFAAGLEEVIVVEDKASFIETGVREILYGTADAPRIVGKKDQDGSPLFPAGGELNAGRLRRPLQRALAPWVDTYAPEPVRIDLPMLESARAPYFCSGCPHNRSTMVPEGSLAGGGIGCHIMVTTSGRAESAVTSLTQMGGEGAQWIGQAPFTDVRHVFQNVGDGTFFHSAQLAIQACVAAGVNITFKLLHNDVVAMTGAQDAPGSLTVAQITHKLSAERVAKIIVCADEPKRHRRRRLAPGTLLWSRDRLEEAQLMLREEPGVTVLIYDQHCAADARRRRKRGTLPQRPTRVLINEAVCEGCGDCGAKSNCLSVQPIETDLGRKTFIDQTSCNTDLSCLDGDCPAFVTVEVDDRARVARPSAAAPPAVPGPPVTDWITQDVFMAGVGGTGIVTANQVLGTAALLAGFEVEMLDQTGLSQKAGPVSGHLRLSRRGLEPANRLSPGGADCILAFDLLTTVTETNLAYGDPAATVAVASTSRTPTGEMVRDPSVRHPEEQVLLTRLATAAREIHSLDALAAATRLLGDSSNANLLVIGAAVQAGALGLPPACIEKAIEANGVAVDANIAAFRWGRVAIADRAEFDRATSLPGSEPAAAGVGLLEDSPVSGELSDLLARRGADLIRFQNRRTALRYLRMVEAVWLKERALTDRTDLSRAVADHLYRLTAYKDEYEVARLLTTPSFLDDVRAELPTGRRLTYRLHPPVLRALGRRTKIGFRPGTHWALRLLARCKFVRGTPLDVFGYARVRRVERALVAHYHRVVDALTEELTAENYDRSVEVATLPAMVRGYESIKLAGVVRYVDALDDLGVRHDLHDLVG